MSIRQIRFDHQQIPLARLTNDAQQATHLDHFFELLVDEPLEKALREVLFRHREAVLRIVSDRPPRFQNLPGNQVEYIPWTLQNQVGLIQEMTVGIMPLDDTVVSRGKCSFKMLLYMACGLPVVVSPVGMNAEVLDQDNVGFAASCGADWVVHLDELLREPQKGINMGTVGRELVVKRYSVAALAPQLAKTLAKVAGRV